MASYRKRNGKWQAIVYLRRDRVTGKMVTRTQSFTTKRHAEQWARRTERERDQGATRAGGRIAVSGIADAWLATQRERVAADDLAPNTFRWYDATRSNFRTFLRRIAFGISCK